MCSRSVRLQWVWKASCKCHPSLDISGLKCVYHLPGFGKESGMILLVANFSFFIRERFGVNFKCITYCQWRILAHGSLLQQGSVQANDNSQLAD